MRREIDLYMPELKTTIFFPRKIRHFPKREIVTAKVGAIISCISGVVSKGVQHVAGYLDSAHY